MHFTSPATAQRSVKYVFQVVHVYHALFLLHICRGETETTTLWLDEGLPALLFHLGGGGGLWGREGAPIRVGRTGQRAHTCAGRPSGQQKQRGGHLTQSALINKEEDVDENSQEHSPASP